MSGPGSNSLGYLIGGCASMRGRRILAMASPKGSGYRLRAKWWNRLDKAPFQRVKLDEALEFWNWYHLYIYLFWKRGYTSSLGLLPYLEIKINKELCSTKMLSTYIPGLTFLVLVLLHSLDTGRCSKLPLPPHIKTKYGFGTAVGILPLWCWTTISSHPPAYLPYLKFDIGHPKMTTSTLF